MKREANYPNPLWMELRCAVSVALLFLAYNRIHVNVVAAEDRKPKEFFQRDFARSDGGPGETSQLSPRDAKTPGRVKVKDSQRGGVSDEPPSPSDPSLVSASKVEGSDEPEKVPHLELYVNSKDPDHLNRVVETTLALLKERRISLSVIYHIGHYGTLSRENRAALEQLNILYSQVTSVPYGGGIKDSPVWVFSPSGDTRIVEGYLTPERFLATNGAEPPAASLESTVREKGDLEGL